MTWILLYLVLAALVVFLSIKLSDFVDLLDKKTKLSGALLGGILLAAVTSLPELFTSLTGTIALGDNQLVLGNIMGSDFFDIVIFGVIYFLMFKTFIGGKVGKQHYYTIFFTALMVFAVILAVVFSKQGWLIGYFNPISLLIIAIYVVSVLKTPATAEKEKEEDTSKLTVKQIWTLFIIFSLVLIAASISVTLVTDKVVDFLGIGATFGGSLFLGVATSLPEVTATITLCKKKNFDAAYGDIFGSCVFNIIILALADALSFKSSASIYQIDSSSLMLIIGTLFVLVLALITITYIRSSKMQNNVKSRVLLYTCGFLMIASYIVYLILSSMNIALI